MLRALLFCLVLGLVLAPAASAAPEIQVIDTATGARHTLLRGWHLLRVPDNTGAIAERGGRVVRVDFADRRITPLPHLSLETLWAYGPHGETFDFVPRASGRTSLTLREPGGGALASYDFGQSWSEPVVAWSPDGTRAALAVARQLRVVDLATGALLLEHTFGTDLGMTRQPFSPDSAALVLAEGGNVLRVDVSSGTVTELFSGDAARRPSASWSEVGPIVVNDGWDVRLLDQPGVPVRTGRDRLSRVAGTSAARRCRTPSRAGSTTAASRTRASPRSCPGSVRACSCLPPTATSSGGARRRTAASSRWTSTTARSAGPSAAASATRGRSASPAGTGCPRAATTPPRSGSSSTQRAGCAAARAVT